MTSIVIFYCCFLYSSIEMTRIVIFHYRFLYSSIYVNGKYCHTLYRIKEPIVFNSCLKYYIYDKYCHILYSSLFSLFASCQVLPYLVEEHVVFIRMFVVWNIPILSKIYESNMNYNLRSQQVLSRCFSKYMELLTTTVVLLYLLFLKTIIMFWNKRLLECCLQSIVSNSHAFALFYVLLLDEPEFSSESHYGQRRSESYSFILYSRKWPGRKAQDFVIQPGYRRFLYNFEWSPWDLLHLWNAWNQPHIRIGSKFDRKWMDLSKEMTRWGDSYGSF